MSKKLIASLGLAVFAFGLGLGLSKPVAASDCTLACLGDRTECRHDCGYNPPEYQAYCNAQCNATYNACMAACAGG